MTRHLLVFLAAFAVGAVIAIILRTAGHKPYAAHADQPADAMPAAAHAEAPMEKPAAMPTPAAADHDHAGHDGMAVGPAAAAPAAPAASPTVNTICPGCGDPVNPALPYADYKGKKVGFGCAMCPPKFKADPVKYGEAALKNQVAEQP